MIDRYSDTWRHVVAWAGERIAESQVTLETPSLDPIATEHQRGRIAALRALLAQADPPAVIPPTDPVVY